jgi:hypothetical protein
MQVVIVKDLFSLKIKELESDIKIHPIMPDNHKQIKDIICQYEDRSSQKR